MLNFIDVRMQIIAEFNKDIIIAVAMGELVPVPDQAYKYASPELPAFFKVINKRYKNNSTSINLIANTELPIPFYIFSSDLKFLYPFID